MNQSNNSQGCPAINPILCGKYTLARGLCVNKKKDCRKRTLKSRNIPILQSPGKGSRYGYVNDNIGKGCFVADSKDLIMDYEAKFTLSDEIPKTFTLATYNIWGLSKSPNLQKLFKLRKQTLIESIQSLKADMICAQEMSEFSYNEMKSFIGTYNFASEIPYPASKTNRNRNVEVYFLSKYRPKRIAVYSMPGVLSYNNSMMVVEYSNLIIFNLYNQAGSKDSPGQAQKWIHYSRCRYDILNIIYNMCKTYYKEKSIAICGDFNFHMDGTKEAWPEIAMLEKFTKFGFIDTYRSLNDDAGLTEDTDKNFMRFNQKLIDKKYRYDAVLYRPYNESWAPVNSEVKGTKMKFLNEANSKWFLEEISEAKSVATLKGVKLTKEGFQIPINASDHFAVVTSFKKD